VGTGVSPIEAAQYVEMESVREIHPLSEEMTRELHHEEQSNRFSQFLLIYHHKLNVDGWDHEQIMTMLNNQSSESDKMLLTMIDEEMESIHVRVVQWYIDYRVYHKVTHKTAVQMFCNTRQPE